MRDLKKSAPVFEFKSMGDDGEIIGYGATFGGKPDSYGDVITKGAFVESIGRHKQAGSRPKMFWQHDPDQVIGHWSEFFEDEAGLMLKGRMNMEIQKAREVRANLMAGDIDGLSIGYRVEEYHVEKEAGAKGEDIWHLDKLDLMEVSVVSIPANDQATVTQVKSQRAYLELKDRLAAGDRLTEREFEMLLKGSLGLSNSQAERAARIHLKGSGEPANAADEGSDFLKALIA